jgi:hypothetical protein
MPKKQKQLKTTEINRKGVKRALLTLAQYHKILDEGGSEGRDDMENLLADLMHLCRAKRWNFSDAIAAATKFFDSECP